MPPLGVIVHLARRVAMSEDEDQPGAVVWVGRRCWPYGRALMGSAGGIASTLLERSIWVDAQSPAERLWAMDVALRGGAVGAVIGDGSGLSLPATRRLQVSAQAGGSMALLVRPAHEALELSAAQTRWTVRHEPAPGAESEQGARARWSIELLRCKGVRPKVESARRWVVRWNHETGDVGLVADTGRRSGEAAGAGRRSALRIA